MMDFLYFPTDKSEYIPAILMSTPFIIGAVLAFVYFRKYSKKEQAKFDKIEAEIMAKHLNS
ncbi:MAG: hypothetical protein ACRCWQ_07980 [Bacilli bacterium]